MSRKPIRKYYYNYKSKSRWNPVFSEVQYQTSVPAQSSLPNKILNGIVDLATNSDVSGTSSPVSTVLQVARFKVKADIVAASTASSSVSIYLLFLPQGVVVPTTSNDLVKQHPEWIMAWNKYSVDDTRTCSLSTGRLKRNLRSGDKVVLVMEFYQNSSTALNFNINISCSYCCRSHS